MTEDELKTWQAKLDSQAALLSIKEHDLLIYEGRIVREYEKLFPGIEVKLR